MNHLLLCLLIGFSTTAMAADIPRTDDGKPNLNGVWQALGEAHWSLEADTARHAPMLREGPRGPLPAAEVLNLGAVIAVPPSPGFIRGDSTIPYNETAAKRRSELRRDWVNQDPEVKCYLPGVPRSNYMPYPFQIFHNASSFTIAYQFAGAYREIYLEDPGEAPVDSWMGWSHGRWEGDTFTVTVTGLGDQTWLDRTGTHHSAGLKVTERYTMKGPDHIAYEATIEDPEVFTKPWTIAIPLYRRMDRPVMLEFKCVEFVEELMFGKWRRNPLPRPQEEETP